LKCSIEVSDDVTNYYKGFLYSVKCKSSYSICSIEKTELCYIEQPPMVVWPLISQSTQLGSANILMHAQLIHVLPRWLLYTVISLPFLFLSLLNKCNNYSYYEYLFTNSSINHFTYAIIWLLVTWHFNGIERFCSFLVSLYSLVPAILIVISNIELQ